ncbi:MAG TPA: radical SAM protein [Flavisolibacter sp.]|nr:radical SAM protein [Flavisolibacter sp.]
MNHFSGKRNNTNMKSKLLFSHSYFLRFDPKQWKNGQPYPPLGTLYAASWLREHGYRVALHDVQLTEGPEELMSMLDKEEPDLFVLYDDGFNYLTKMCLTNMREAAFRMIAMARRAGCIVIVSSSDATDHYADYLKAGAHFVLMGEAELTLLELAEALWEKQPDFDHIRGLVFMKDEKPFKTPARSVLKDLDSLPLPAWDLVDLAPYKKSWQETAGYFSLNVGTTRGCPFKCNWCAKPIYGNRYNVRTPENVVAELKLLREAFGVDHIWFCDDIFGLKPGWVEAFGDAMEAENLRVRFKIQSRADLLVQEKYVEALAKAGCEEVWMGAESGSQKILDAMDKGITVEQIAQATSLLKQHGIKPCFFIQFGYPGETGEDIQKTIAMINTLLPHNIGISVSYPLPGTVFYENVKEELKQKANWSHSDELALMFKNTYPPPFYKHLHRYVHRNYRFHIAKDHLRRLIKSPAKVSWPVIKRSAAGICMVPAMILTRIRLAQYQKS